MMRALLCAALGAWMALPVGAQGASECGRIGPLTGQALGVIEVELPPGAARVWALLEYPGLPLFLPLRPGASAGAGLMLPLTAAPDAPDRLPLTLIGLDEAGEAVWLCGALTLDIHPLPPDPGGTLRLAARTEALASRFERLLGAADGPMSDEVAPIAAGLRDLAAELRALPDLLEPDELAQIDTTLGAVARHVGAADASPRRRGLFRAAGPFKFFPADLVNASPSLYAPDRNFDVCPAGPRQLTEMIDLAVRARINTSADQQFLFTTGVSGLAFAVRIGARGPAGRYADIAATTINTAQAVMSDYLAGMMPLNLDRLELSHDPADVQDDTPPEYRLIRVHSARLHTRSEGWSPDKAALDTVLGLVSLRTGGASGAASDRATAALRGQADDLVQATRLGQAHGIDVLQARRNYDLAQRNAERAEAVAEALGRQAAERPVPLSEVARIMDARDAARASAREFGEASTQLTALRQEAATAATAERTAAGLRGLADRIEDGYAPVAGVVEGQATGAATGVVGERGLGPIGRIVQRCRVEMLRDEDGRRSRHLVFDVVEGDGEVIQVGLGARIGFEVVGSGIRTARVALNPGLEYFPITRVDSLPEALIAVNVRRIHTRIEGLPGVVQPWSNHALSAAVSGTLQDPPLTWEVEPPMPLTVTGLRGSQVELIVPEDTPEGTLIVVRVRAEGDFISAAQAEPVWVAVAQVREDEPQQVDGPGPCLPDAANRLRRVPPGSLLARRYAGTGFSQTEVNRGFCPSGSYAGPATASRAPGFSIGRDQGGVTAWGGLPLYRVAHPDWIDTMLAERGTCAPATPWGPLRDWLGEELAQAEVYLVGSCFNIMILTPSRGVILEYVTYLEAPIGLEARNWVWVLHVFEPT